MNVLPLISESNLESKEVIPVELLKNKIYDEAPEEGDQERVTESWLVIKSLREMFFDARFLDLGKIEKI